MRITTRKGELRIALLKNAQRILTMAISENDGTASLDLALSAAGEFGLKKEEAKEIAAAVGAIVAGWRETAAAADIGKAEIDRMASAFEHDDLEQALA
jgi:serine/threonine-protein kinase HipA